MDSPTSANQNQQFSNNLTPLSVRALKARLEAMTLKYKAAKVVQICGEDVPPPLYLLALISDIHTLLYAQAGRREGACVGLQVHS